MAGGGRLAAKAVGVLRRRPRTTFPRQALHAATLGFEHPVTGERLEFVSPLPADMEGLIAMLRALTSA